MGVQSPSTLATHCIYSIRGITFSITEELVNLNQLNKKPLETLSKTNSDGCLDRLIKFFLLQ